MWGCFGVRGVRTACRPHAQSVLIAAAFSHKWREQELEPSAQNKCRAAAAAVTHTCHWCAGLTYCRQPNCQLRQAVCLLADSWLQRKVEAAAVSCVDIEAAWSTHACEHSAAPSLPVCC